MTREEILRKTLDSIPEPVSVFQPLPEDFTAGGALEMGTLQVVAVEGEGFGNALEMRTLLPGREPWSFQAITPVESGAKKNDTLLAVFRVRNPHAADGADAQSELVIERAGEPYDKSLSHPVRTTGDWTLHYVPFKAHADFLPGQWNLIFRGGYQVQTLQVAEVQLRNFADRVRMDELPRIAATYEGMEPDAPWRAEAAERIERMRKGDLSVRVLDADGRPVKDAAVRVEMTRHAFLFGSAVKFHWIADPDRDIYRRHIEELFNHVVNENDLKWPCWEADTASPFSREKSLQALRWLKERGIHVKGHCIIWPSWQHTVKRLQEVRENPDAMRRMIDGHIEDLVSTTGPRVDEWDVINEPFNNHDVMKVLGDGEMITWFKKTREWDPTARLYLNDFGILAAGGMTDTPHQAHFEKTLQFLLDGGAPLSGIGMQSHFGENVTPPETLWKILDRFAVFALPIQITEFDVNTLDETMQANYQRDFMTAVFAHESVNGFVMWGFYEGAHWRPEAALFRRDWSLKPNGEVFKRLVFEEWWTRERLRSDAEGRVELRGFLGDYRVTVSHDGRDLVRETALGPDGLTLDVTLP